MEKLYLPWCINGTSNSLDQPKPILSHLLFHLPFRKSFVLRNILILTGFLLSQTSFGQVVISQVYGGAGCGTPGCSTYKNDYIEIFNRGAAAVSVNGWSVQYAASTGTSWQVTNLPNVSIPAGGYLLIAEGAGANGVNNLPTPDVTGSIAMSATGAKVALLNTTTALSGACPSSAAIMDFVGFGTTANCNEGGANAPAPSTTTAAIRGSGGCTDTNANNLDFAAGAPNPRNSATALNPCSAPVLPNLSINDVSLSEGNVGTTNFTFTVSLSAPAPAGGVTFDIATADGTATDVNNDFEPQSLTSQTIPAGESSYTFTVVVNRDVTFEPNEAFFVNVTNVTGAIALDNQGVGTILNDDCPTLNITVTETSGIASNDGQICIGASATLTATGGGTYAWNTTETTASITVAPNITTLYTVTVTNGVCVGTDTLTIHVFPVPLVFNVTGGGSYCGVGPGVEIGVDGSQVGVSYFLYRNNLYVDDIPGTGSAISFGFFTLPGNYVVVGSYPTNCFVGMTGTAVINTNGPSFTATPTNGACPESDPYVTLNVPAASGYKYDISTGATYTGTMTAGSGGTVINADPLEVDVFPSAPGVGGTQYTVRVIDVATGCYSDQTFTVAGIPNDCECEAPPLVNFTPFNVTSCNGATVTIGYTVQNGPATILNSGFSGTLSTTTLNNGTGTFTYTPTAGEIGSTLTIIASIEDPDGAGSCEPDTATVNIQVNPLTEPTFFSPGTFCEGAIPTILPTTSNNGITGTWDPSSISTSTPGTYTFVFTPDPGQCADTASVKARVVAKREPAFSVNTTYCVDDTPDALPGFSLGGDTGTWEPSSINTSTAGTLTYVFTPTPGACADTASVKITINPKVKPTFSILSTYCQGQTPANLPTTSNNGVVGTWNPSTISTATVGTITYVFTPDNAECTDTASAKVVVSQPVSVEAGTPQTICVNQTLDLSELNASITGGATTGTWSSSGTGSFTGGTAFGTATAYVPSTADKAAGTITLTLTSVAPDGPCPAVVDTVVITIRNFNCSTFPWNGGK